jgi:nicotinate-nucleotide--dimethylbenzimidazole phosphoribosyltransferase
MTDTLTGIDAVLFDVGGTLVDEAAPGTPTRDLVARPRPGALERLRSLAADYRLGAVTDTAVMSGDDVRGLLAPVGLDELLEVVFTSSDVGAMKPDPASIRAALGKLGVAPERALFVGDRAVDRDAARAAGVRFVAVDGGIDDAWTRAVRRETSVAIAAADAIRPLDVAAKLAAAARDEQLTKPRGSLGRLESLAAQLAGLVGAAPPPVPAAPAVAVFAGDHGVARSGVTPWPQDITAQMVVNFARGGAAINAVARQVGASVTVVDVGVATPVPEIAGIVHRRVRAGTDDLAEGPAMTVLDAFAALDVGTAIATELVDGGADLLVTGDMGIGNTTPSAALIAAFTGASAHETTGRGTGIDDEMLAHKTAIVAAAVARTDAYLDPISILAEVGGLEIAALAGFILAGAARRVPVVVDGVIACAALLVADALAPAVRDLVIAGHRSVEPGASAALRHLGLVPLLDLDLRLGEGTGACLAVPIVQTAARVAAEMATFADLGAP